MKLVIFDTNAWLDLYMIHPLALKEIVSKFEQKKMLFWIPEQVYWEFNKHSTQKRECALNVIKNASSDARERISQANDQIKKTLTSLKNSAILSDDKIIFDIEAQFGEIKEKIKNELDTLNTEYQKSMDIISEGQDVIYRLVNEIYKANPPYMLTEVQRIKLYEEGELRIKYGIPPGLTDNDKDDSNDNVVYRRRYGDFLIWKDVLRKTSELIQNLKDNETLSVVFVENEKKGDWWINRGERTISPILKEEFEFVAKGKANIEMLSFTDYLTTQCNDFGIETTTVKSLVEKSKYKESIIVDINNNAEELLKKALIEYYLPSAKYEKMFNERSYLGGSFRSVKDFKIDIKEIKNTTLEEDSRGLCLIANITFDYSGELTESIDREHYETEIVNDTYNAVVIVEISIDYSHGYDSKNYDIGKVYLQGFKTNKRRTRVSKLKVFERDAYTCQMCGKSIYQGAMLNVDHIIPLSCGGTDDLDNMQTLCVECHSIKDFRLSE